MVCSITGQVEHYYNFNGYIDYLDLTNRTIGLDNTSVINNNGWIICSFTRYNNISNSKYYSLTQNYFILGADGRMSSTSKLQY